MSVRKREWTTPAGVKKTAWLVDYRDGQGKRRAKQFTRKKEADEFSLKAGHEVKHGTHTADSQSITVKKAGELWIARGKREGLEQSTLDAYDQHLRLHIEPFLGAKRLNQLSKPLVEGFRDDLLDNGRSKAMVSRVLRSLTSLVSEAHRLGHVAQNVCSGVRLRRGSREKPKVVPPTKVDMRALIEQAQAWGNEKPMVYPMLLVLNFAGLRASELRALAWRHIDLQRGTITIDQRADFRNVIGPPKSASGRRTIPIPPIAVTGLKAWKAQCPASTLNLVFPSDAGTPMFHPNITDRIIEPLQIAAGVVQAKMKDGKPVVTEEGEGVMEGRYTLHCFRHAAASLWIERRVAPKKVQTWMGHHSIQVTFDTYGHLFSALDEDDAVMAAMEAEVMGTAPIAEAA